MLRRVKPLCLSARLLATGRRIIRRPPTSRSSPAKTAPGPLESDPALAAASADPWTEVKDPTSGQIYYWNRVTNETTALGAPKPTSPAPQPQPQPQQESLAGSLGKVDLSTSHLLLTSHRTDRC